jgi:hypothetical protein
MRWVVVALRYHFGRPGNARIFFWQFSIGGARGTPLLKINSLINKVALPRGLQGLSNFSGLLTRLATDVSRPFS